MSNTGYEDIIVLLDKSGSMINSGNEPIEAMNKFISDQKEVTPEGSPATLSFYTFSTFVETVYSDQLLCNIGKFEKYEPNGLTSLYDAIRKAITDKLCTDRKDNVILLIVTDGKDNSSQKTTQKEAKDMISEVELKYNWKTIFLGANIDVQQESKNISNRAMSISFDQQVAGGLYREVTSVSRSISAMRTREPKRLPSTP